MTPKDKAKELVDKMYQYQWRKDTIEFRNAKQCALIAVDEVLSVPYLLKGEHWFYKEVKKEIELL